jgi:hypothetical protein
MNFPPVHPSDEKMSEGMLWCFLSPESEIAGLMNRQVAIEQADSEKEEEEEK